MTAACGAPIPLETLVAYWADDLDPVELDGVEEHLMACDACTAESARVSTLTSALRAVIPAFVDHARLEALRALGHRITENPILPDQRTPVVFGAHVDLLVHKLRGLALDDAAGVGITITVEETGDVLLDEPSIPFDPTSGEVLIVCQRHFAAFPRNIVASVRTRDRAGHERTARYPIPHVFEARSE